MYLMLFSTILTSSGRHASDAEHKIFDKRLGFTEIDCMPSITGNWRAWDGTFAQP
jgi:hypothetical protein